MIPASFGLAGATPSEAERVFFRQVDPAGFILFRRNCESRGQVRALTDALRALMGRDLPILIDQEGGRVARLRPPEWPAFPPAWAFAELYAAAPMSALQAVRLNAAALGRTLREIGVNVDCAPSLDLRWAGGDDIVGDRALGADPMQVAALGRMMLHGLGEAGVAGVIKHLPGHGRARVDSHHALPVIEADEAALEADIAPFRALASATMGMTGHLLFTAWDPARPATLSPFVIGEIIRRRIGFDGLLMSDDLGMNALGGDFGTRAAGAIAAGCDIALHCSGEMAEMAAVAGALGEIGAGAAARLARAMAAIGEPDCADLPTLLAERDRLLGVA